MSKTQKEKVKITQIQEQPHDNNVDKTVCNWLTARVVQETDCS